MAFSPGTELTAALAEVWSAIQRRHPDLPSVVLLAAPNPHGNLNVLGHFAALRWKGTQVEGGGLLHEVVVVAEHLNRSAEDIVATLLHEAAHALCFQRGIYDCSKSQYHNQKFKTAAEEVGLQVTQVAHYGFAATTLPAETAGWYDAETVELQRVLLHRRSMVNLPAKPPKPGTGDAEADKPDEGEPPETGGRYKKASCGCPYNIRVARTTLAKTSIRCESCGEAFQLNA